MIIFKSSDGNRSLILGTRGEQILQQALIRYINSGTQTSEANKKEAEQILEYSFGNLPR